jgi:hypothetical protein
LNEDSHPLEGVLDRLLTLERSGDRHEISHPPDLRRMLVIAGMSPAADRHTLLQLAGWALEAGRVPALIDLAAGERPVLAPEDGGSGTSIQAAVLPSVPERLQSERAEVLAAVLERLRKIELSSDLLLLRIPYSRRMMLMKAAFMAGGMVIPLEHQERTLAEAYRLTRETVRSFDNVEIWPLPLSEPALARYHSMTSDFLGIRPDQIDGARFRSPGLLELLPEPPGEGYTYTLLQERQDPPPADLLRIGTITI